MDYKEETIKLIEMYEKEKDVNLWKYVYEYLKLKLEGSPA